MKTMSLSEAKAKLSRLINTVIKFDEEIIITKNGQAAAVLISPEEYESFKETMIIKKDAEFMDEIRRSLKKFDTHAKLYSLEELFGDK